MKYVTAITLYNPTKKQIENIRSYSKTFDVVYLLDNSDKESIFDSTYFSDENIVYLSMGGNVGLPTAFNHLINSNYLNDVDFLCTLDQDSIFEEEQIKNIKLFIDNILCSEINAINDIGIVAPMIVYGAKDVEIKKSYKETNKVITSGAFINMHIVRENKFRYDEQYFIDKFEIDFCQQMVSNGYNILVYEGAILRQRLGDEGRFGHSSHNKLRHYYLFRNRFYFNKKFYGLFKCVILNFLQTLKHVLSIFIYEKEARKKISQLFIAYRDFKSNNMGKKQ